MSGPDFPRWDTPESFQSLKSDAASIKDLKTRRAGEAFCDAMSAWLAGKAARPDNEFIALARTSSLRLASMLGLADGLASVERPELLEAIYDVLNTSMRRRFIFYLCQTSRLGEKAFVELLVTRALRDRSKQVRLEAAATLADRTLRVPKARLRQAMEEERDRDVRDAFVKSMALREHGFHAVQDARTGLWAVWSELWGESALVFFNLSASTVKRHGIVKAVTNERKQIEAKGRAGEANA